MHDQGAIDAGIDAIQSALHELGWGYAQGDALGEGEFCVQGPGRDGKYRIRFGGFARLLALRPEQVIEAGVNPGYIKSQGLPRASSRVGN